MASACPLCASPDLVSCADLGSVPVLQNARYGDPASARRAPLGHLRLAVCRSCGFAFNAAFRPDLARYGETYENDQTASDRFVGHVAAVVEHALSLVSSVADPTVVEIGCGQGMFLRQVLDASQGRIARAIGFDPSLRKPVAEAAFRVEARAFDTQAARSIEGGVDLVVLRHVIEHIHRPLDLLVSIRTLIAAGGSGRILIETPCFAWILAHHAWHDVFYEHCNYFTAEALAHLMQRAGFAHVIVDHVFEGQYLLASAEVGPDGGRAPGPSPGGTGVTERVQAFGRSFDDYVRRWRERLAEPTPLAIWGAGAKGVTFASIIGQHVPLRCLIDIDPKKQGTFAARTGYPIMSLREAAAQGVRRVLVMNPNYAREVEAFIAELGRPLEIIVMDQDT